MSKKMYWMIFGLMGVALIGLLWFMFPSNGGDKGHRDVPVSVPEGIAEEIPDSKRVAYQEKSRRSVSTDEYFEMLAEEEISLVSDAGEEMPGQAGHDGRSLVGAGDDGGYGSGGDRFASGSDGRSAAERVFGPAPVNNPTAGNGTRRNNTSPTMSEKDKLEYDRRRAEMVRDVITGQSESAATESDTTDGVNAEDDKIDLNWEQDGGVVFSLDDEFSDDGVTYSDAAKRPFRCMFIRDEKLKDGQRVTLRLLENYQDEGTRIPANAHLNAICKIGERLELTVKSIELNGKIIPLNLCAYDTDGIKGIYCPETSSNKNAKKAENDALSASGVTFGGLVGDIANTIIRTGVNIARSSTGEKAVNVSSGYEFFLVKSERR